MDTYCGKLIIDSDYIIKVADENFFLMVGEGNYISLLNSIFSEDLSKVKASVDATFKTHEVQMCCYRSKTVSGDWPWLVCRMSYQKNDRIAIEYTPAEEIYSLIQSESNFNKEYNTYLDLSGTVWIRYDLNECLLTICAGGYNRIPIFSGTLDELVLFAEENSFIHENSLTDFNKAVNDFRNGVHHFEYTLMVKANSRGEHYRNHLLKCKTIDYSDNHKCVFGIIDISGRGKNNKLKINSADNLDSMTGLLNKKAITTYACERIASKPSQSIHIGIIDLDNFKYVNDVHGHRVGDEVLIAAAKIINETMIGKGQAGRIGGDEMMIVIEDANDLAELRAILRTIRTNIEYVYKTWDKEINVTCSMGVSSYPDHGTDYESLFEIADKMLYLAKEKGKNRYIIYTPEIHNQYINSNNTEFPKVPVSSNKVKEDLVLNLIENMLYKPIIPHLNAFSEIGSAFALDEICMFIGRLDSPENYWQLKHSMSFNENIHANYINNRNLFDKLKNSSLLVVDHLEDIENIYPEMFDYFKHRSINSAIILNVSTQKTQAYMTLYKMTVQSRKWSDQDLAYLKFIGKIISLSL